MGQDSLCIDLAYIFANFSDTLESSLDNTSKNAMKCDLALSPIGSDLCLCVISSNVADM